MSEDEFYGRVLKEIEDQGFSEEDIDPHFDSVIETGLSNGFDPEITADMFIDAYWDGLNNFLDSKAYEGDDELED